MISVTELRRGKIVKIDGELYVVLDYLHHKPGRGNAIIRSKMRSLKKGHIVDKTFGSGESIEEVYVERKPAQFVYKDENNDYVFMDMETYEQLPASAETLGDYINFLAEEMELEIDIYEGEIINLVLPSSVILEVTYTEPGLKGDSSGGVKKPATLQTGHNIKVPLFIKTGDKVKIDTTSGEYIERM